jgi:hypothetical protein
MNLRVRKVTCASDMLGGLSVEMVSREAVMKRFPAVFVRP